jgi:hypothetical protein
VRKPILSLVLAGVAFVYGAIPANATVTGVNILFQDLTDSPTLSGSGRLSGILCTSAIETCTATLMAPAGYLAAGIIGSRLGEGSKTGNVSDAFVGVIAGGMAQLTFTSDIPNAAGEANGLGPCVVPVLFPGGCNAVENGTPQLVGTITWRSLTGATITDNIFLQSDVAPVPEPTSFMLFGSGLGIAAGFLRRRRRLPAPSA